MVSPEISDTFGNRVRVRVCGIVIDDGAILLVDHNKLTESGQWWAPPGGGVQFGETLEKALVREFKEETGLTAIVEEQLFITEFIEAPFHAIEIFFKVKIDQGDISKGNDPELSNEKQIITQVKYVTFSELGLIRDENKHQCLKDVTDVSDLISKNQ